tara:strand:- start:14 stop:247 length:234 start_codon:yes stop_codon:yes gene_type:complete
MFLPRASGVDSEAVSGISCWVMLAPSPATKLASNSGQKLGAREMPSEASASVMDRLRISWRLSMVSPSGEISRMAAA